VDAPQHPPRCATIEAGGGFQFEADIDESFTWMLEFVDRGLIAHQRTLADSAP